MVKTVNPSYPVYSTAGATLMAPTATSTLWSGFGGACQTSNDGDPVVLFDKLANRWFITQFTATSPYFQCVAVSTTASALGTYYRYSFATLPSADLGDYPHYGVWSDGYYHTAHMFPPAPATNYDGGIFGA